MSKEKSPINKIRSSVGGGLMAVAIIGCTTLNQAVETPTIEPTPIVQPTEKYPEIGLYYPSLTTFKILETGQVNTERGSTKWLNLSSANFDPALASRVIDYFEKLAGKRDILIYRFSGHSMPLLLDLKPRTNRVIFLIPPQAPTPDWQPDVSWTASTTGIFKSGPYVSVVRVYNKQQDIPQSKVFTTIDKAANKALAVEICQSTIQVSSSTTEMANLGQELFCNSWGAAFTLKQYGLTYDQYNRWARDTKISANPQSPSYPLYVVTESDYQQIPKIGEIIKN